MSDSYWACAQLLPQRDRLALHCLALAGFETYTPRLREQRIAHGRKITRTPLLFPGYLFVLIVAQWHSARRRGALADRDMSNSFCFSAM
jgi:hypothetical protein